MATTIRDVARQANVSVATVSRVLNNKGNFSKETAKKVKEVMKELNYRPNAVARTLYNKSSSMIGLILPDITNPFFPSLARAVEDKALSYGYTVVLCNADGDKEKEERYIESLEQKYIDGIIVSTSQLKKEAYKRFNVPIVALDRFLEDDIPLVLSKNEKGAMEATGHLIHVGRDFIAHVRGPKDVTTADDRQRGFLQVVEGKKLNYRIIESKFNSTNAEEITFQLLKENPSINGIFAGSDLIAIGILRALHKMNRSVPTDIQVIGFDGVYIGQMLIPTLTTVEQPIYEMGALAVDLLYKQINGEKLGQFRYEFPTKLIKGNTTKDIDKGGYS